MKKRVNWYSVVLEVIRVVIAALAGGASAAAL